MTTHPAADTFAFDPARVGCHPSNPQRLTYPLPDGRVLEAPVQPPSSNIVVRAWTPEGKEIPQEAFKIRKLFERTVAGLSAHQKMTWAATARAHEQTENR